MGKKHTCDVVMCAACGEELKCPTDIKYIRRKFYCNECYLELAFGYIAEATGPALQSLASHLTPRQAAKLYLTS